MTALTPPIGSASEPALARSRAATTTGWLLAAAVIMMLVLQLIMQSLFPPIGFIQAVIFAVPLIMVWRRVRGAFITTAVVVVLVLVASLGPIVEDLSHPGRWSTFVWTAVVLPLLAATFVAAIVAAVASHRARSTARSVLDS